jgi:hypothetical protein
MKYRIFMNKFRATGVGVLIVASIGCASIERTPQGEVADCMREPALFDWQPLDAGNVIVWTYPTEQAYHIALDSDLRLLTTASALELVDGNRDGLVCDAGWDSLLAIASAPGDDRASSSTGAEAAIYYVSPLTPDDVASLREAHAETLGERFRGSGPSI